MKSIRIEELGTDKVPEKLEGMGMESWHTVQVRTGREESVLHLIKKIVDRTVLIECSIPYCERMKRYQGEWHKERSVLSPGYVLLITERVDELLQELKKIPELTKILGGGAGFIPLREKERKMLTDTGGRDRLFEMSRGYIVGDQVIITSSPTRKMEGKTTFTDRRKWFAVVQMDMFGRKIDVKIGLEIIRKQSKGEYKHGN